ncbi:MAG: protein kinase domain-containing protein [Candidatus Eiseniibacteriota bacterium]
MPQPVGLNVALEGRYRLVAEAGQGASASVYEALDLKHGRRVALKVLLPEVAHAVGQDRFLREIELAASLQHPHILPLYDSGAAGSFLYYATPMVEGGSLRDRLARDGELPLDEALRIAAEAADGLDFAHQRGVIHRDIKPENILLSSGPALVADFGIARALSGETALALTATGFAVGTPAYMSPEQAAGSARVDARADLYSLGCVLFEMLAGRPPFVGSTTESIIRQHLAVEPPDLRILRPAIGEGIGRFVSHLLAKDPIDRPAEASTVRDFLERARHEQVPGAQATQGPRSESAPRQSRGLRAIALLAGSGLAIVALVAVIRWLPHGPGGTGRAAIGSVAVLPLQNLSGDPEQEYFADGVTEALINDLSRIGALRVISRTSAMALKGAKDPLPVLARRLGVDALIEGSVTRAGNRVRITAQLVRARPEESLWADSYEREVEEILALQSDVARSIARAVRVRLTPEEEARIAAGAPRVNPEAHDAYLRGRHFLTSKLEGDGYRRALAEFERAIRIDPAYAPAWAGLADAYYNLSTLFLSPGEAMPKARAATERALAIDSTLAEGILTQAIILAQYDWDWDAAEERYRRALDLNPNDAWGRVHYSALLLERGRTAESVTEVRRARELDPLSQFIAVLEGFALMSDRRYDEAIAVLRPIIASDSTAAQAQWTLALCYEARGSLDSALSAGGLAVAQSGHAHAMGILGRIQAKAGHTTEARRLLQ